MPVQDSFEKALTGKTIDQKLQFLYHRRQAIDNLIRSLEAANREDRQFTMTSSRHSIVWPSLVA